MNRRYNELNEIIHDQLIKSKTTKPKPDVCDYNKIVGLLHDDAFKDAQLSRKAKMVKLAKRHERKIMKMER